MPAGVQAQVVRVGVVGVVSLVGRCLPAQGSGCCEHPTAAGWAVHMM